MEGKSEERCSSKLLLAAQSQAHRSHYHFISFRLIILNELKQASVWAAMSLMC